MPWLNVLMDDERNVKLAGLLGRLLTWIGFVWVSLIVLGGMGILNPGGPLGDFIARFLTGGILPAFVLLAAGRALRRRSRKRVEELEQPDESLDRPPATRAEPPAPAPVKASPAPAPPKPPQPRPETKPAPKSLEEALFKVEDRSSMAPEHVVDDPAGLDLHAAPKTSQEMIDEARRKFRPESP